ncbi:MAG: SpoIIE family protein phosphatase [Gammaproteobacteria bacterium]|nr:SpoIIE family protein phosphatase [Gammaproteobacteria bacterium]
MPGAPPTPTAEHERLQLLFRQAQSTSVMAAVAAVACALVIMHAVPGPGPWVWMISVLVITALRLQLYRRFFQTQPGRHPPGYWLKRHALAAAPVGIAAGALPLLHLNHAPLYIQEMQTLVPALVAMAAITSFGVYLAQYLVLLLTTILTVTLTRLWVDGAAAVPTIVMMNLLAPILALTAKRYGDSIKRTLEARQRSESLVDELTTTNNDLAHRNELMAQQQDLLEQEEELAKHVFQRLIVGGDHKLTGVHTWNQPMGSLSGDLIQTAKGPGDEAYVFIGDFTGHGLPAALGALPASSVFLAMSAKGLPVDVIARELNRKLRELLPVGYFCCAVLVQLSADRTHATVWNGGLPPILIKRNGQAQYEQIASHALPLGVIDDSDFESDARRCALEPGDALYVYTDGLTEAENIDGDMWGRDRLHEFLQQPELDMPKLPALIDAVLEHVNLAPPSDDISVVEIEATPLTAEEADAA